MKKSLILVIVIPLLMIAVLWNHLNAATSTPEMATAVAPTTATRPAAIPVNNHPIPGALRLSALQVYGPNICTAFGDPYSPWNSPWAPGPYTYKFAIEIPADYAYDTIRVELLDPDSINQAQNDALVTYSDTAVAHGLPTTPTLMSCTNGTQRDPCLIETEMSLVTTNALPLAAINPFWHVRLDANRGTGAPPGSGNCGTPTTYTPAYNTRTLFQLYYDRLNPDSTVTRMNLATYTGQDWVDAHDTDLRWVSPGGTVRADQSTFVPVDAGSPQSFSLHLQTDLPNMMMDAATGKRYLYLDVTTISGSSANAFHIWAGPEAPNVNLPSDVNQRNVFLVDHPEYDAYSLPVYALGDLSFVSFMDGPITQKMAYVPASYAGETIMLSTFDVDSGSNPPVVATLDALTAVDWSQTYPTLSGNNAWITYPVTMPTGMATCDYLNPNAADCTPFSGGWLALTHNNGRFDGQVWSAALPDLPVDNTTPCEGVFPIGLESAVVSLDPANFPDAAAFDYPLTPPTLADFPRHISNTHLLANQPDTLYKVRIGAGFGNFTPLSWNEGRLANADLINSMTWPGDIGDYANHYDPLGPYPYPYPVFPYPVRGYIEAGDPTDQTFQINDWVAASRSNFTVLANSDALNSLIDTGRLIRLPLWQINGYYEIPLNAVLASGFGLFQLHGYQWTQDPVWILLELVHLEEGCGQPPKPKVRFAETAYEVTEDTAVLTIPVTIDPWVRMTIPVTVTLAGTAVSGDDYQLTSPNPIIFPAYPSLLTTQTITLTITDDVAIEGNETITLTLHSDPTLAQTNTSTTVTILDNDYANYLPFIHIE